MDEQERINYCLYARKSSESDERQAMSIDSQIKEMQDLAENENIFIKEIYQESHSAKASGHRPVFNKLIVDIRSGKFNGILTWAPDRLSRNAGDLGVVVDLMDQGKLQHIRTYGQTFANTPNEKFLLMILCSQAKLENDNKGVNVKRGIRAKCEMGWRPGPAPLGYINRSLNGMKTIDIDPERAPIIKEAFEKAAYYFHTGDMIKSFMDQAGFTTRSGKKISRSMTYLMMQNPFYYGRFEYPANSGKWYDGAHKAIITKEVFDEVQKEFKSDKSYNWGANIFPFKGILTCYSCGSGVCGEMKKRKLKGGGHRKHIYYHCTRSKDRKCKEGYITERALIREILARIDEIPKDKLEIPDALQGVLREYEKIIKEAKYLSDYGFNGELTNRDYADYIIRMGTPKAIGILLKDLDIPYKLNSKKLCY